MVPDQMRWWRDLRTDDEVRLIEVDVSHDENLDTAVFEPLNADEKARWSRYAYSGPKRRFAYCRAALRFILCEVIGCENEDLRFVEDEIGKSLALVQGERTEINFNVSHSGNFGLIALGKPSLLGIDIEARRFHRNLELLATTELGPAEKADLARSGNWRKHDVFLDYWTVKEAILKAVGVGVSSVELAQIEVPSALRAGHKTCQAKFPQISDNTWRIENLGNVRYAAALAFNVDE